MGTSNEVAYAAMHGYHLRKGRMLFMGFRVIVFCADLEVLYGLGNAFEAVHQEFGQSSGTTWLCDDFYYPPAQWKFFSKTILRAIRLVHVRDRVQTLLAIRRRTVKLLTSVKAFSEASVQTHTTTSGGC